MSLSGYWNRTGNVPGRRYGMACRSFFVPRAKCQALSLPVPGSEPLLFAGAWLRARVAVLIVARCLAPGLWHRAWRKDRA